MASGLSARNSTVPVGDSTVDVSDPEQPAANTVTARKTAASERRITTSFSAWKDFHFTRQSAAVLAAATIGM
jgi:hypothetical protein